MKDTESRRKELYQLLGDLPDRKRPISARKILEEEREGYVLEKLALDLNGIEEVPAYFVRPKKLQGRVPCILYNHAHGGNHKLGKNEFIEPHEVYFQKPPYANVFTDKGYCGLCLDAWNFGERSGRTETELFKEMLWHGKVLWGMMVYDSLRAIDYLCGRPEVDSNRLGTLGLSMGSTMAWWTAALDPRIKVTVDICCLTDFQALIETRALDRHGLYYYVPGLLKHFTTAQINALIAPRPHLSLAGNRDPLTPPAGLDRIDQEVSKVYTAQGAADRWKLLHYDSGHLETAAMRTEIIEFLGRWL